MADAPTAAEMERAINDAVEWWVADTRMRDHAREMYSLLKGSRALLYSLETHLLQTNIADRRVAAMIAHIDALMARIKGEKADG